MKEPHSPLVSIIIPVWNTGDSVVKIIKKLLNQAYRHIEIIVIDDGSTDDSLEKLKQLQQDVRDDRLKIFHQENAGPSAARNHGLEKVRGEYICFIDSDDDFDDKLITKLVASMVSNTLTALAVAGKRYTNLTNNTVKLTCVSRRHKRREHESLATYIIWLMLLDGRIYNVTGKIYKAEPIRKYNLRFAEDWNFAEDTKFVLEYLEVAKGEIEFILEPLYWYNFGTETSVVKTSALKWCNWQKSYQHLREWARRINRQRMRLSTSILLLLIGLRWKISHIRSVRRSKSK